MFTLGNRVNKQYAQMSLIKLLSCINVGIRRRSIISKKIFEINEEVIEALKSNRPVVALESTIITHGMPFPDNIRCAKEVEAIIRTQGAVPATVAILEGKVKVGLTAQEIDFLGDINTSKPIKTSRRDLPYVLASNKNGGTTVSGTLVIANKAGIKVFATGGIGGVHRRVDETFDISADLTELGKTGMAVVSSGVKSILDIPKTLEFLETQGVFVATYGTAKDFPAFYSSQSGYKSPYNIESALKAAQIINYNKTLNMESGMLFAVPVPDEYSISPDLMNTVIGNAVEKAVKLNISGKDVTPFLLSEVAALTKGKSLLTNMELIKNNARVAADIAVELEMLEKSDQMDGKADEDALKRPIIIGGSNLDCTAELNVTEIKLDGRMHNGKFKYVAGGVARNICEALYKLNVKTNFITAVGDDHQGLLLKSQIPNECNSYVKIIPCERTSQCIVGLDRNGDMPLLLGDMEIHKRITTQMVTEHEELIKNAPLLILDGNLTEECMNCALELAAKHKVPVFFEPTDIVTATKPFTTSNWKSIKYMTPNLLEAKEILHLFDCKVRKSFSNKIEEAAVIAHLLATNYIDNVIITLGSDGVIIANRSNASSPFLSQKVDLNQDVKLRHYKVKEKLNVTSVVGAGDCLASGIISGMLNGHTEEVSVNIGLKAAEAALNASSPIPDQFLDWTNEKAPYETIHI